MNFIMVQVAESQERQMMFPEVAAALQHRESIIRAIGKSKKASQRLASHLVGKEVAKDRFLLIWTPGTGFLMPPQWSARVDVEIMGNVLQELLQEFETDTQAPKGPLERAIAKCLQMLRKGEVVQSMMT